MTSPPSRRARGLIAAGTALTVLSITSTALGANTSGDEYPVAYSVTYSLDLAMKADGHEQCSNFSSESGDIVYSTRFGLPPVKSPKAARGKFFVTNYSKGSTVVFNPVGRSKSAIVTSVNVNAYQFYSTRDAGCPDTKVFQDLSSRVPSTPPVCGAYSYPATTGFGAPRTGTKGSTFGVSVEATTPGTFETAACTRFFPRSGVSNAPGNVFSAGGFAVQLPSAGLKKLAKGGATARPVISQRVAIGGTCAAPAPEGGGAAALEIDIQGRYKKSSPVIISCTLAGSVTVTVKRVGPVKHQDYGG